MSIVWSNYKRPSAAEMRALCGKHVAFRRAGWGHQEERIGVVIGISHKNVQIDNDWYWLGAVGFSFDTLRAAPEHDKEPT